MRYRISLLICVLACQVLPTVPLSDWTDWTDADMEPTIPMMDDWWHEDDEGTTHKYLSDEEPDLVLIQLSCLASLLIAFCIPFAKEKEETQSELVEEIKEETLSFPPLCPETNMFSPIPASSSSSFRNRKRFGPRTTPTAAPMDMSFFIPEPLTPTPTFFIPEPVQLQEEYCNPAPVAEKPDLYAPAIAQLALEQDSGTEIPSSHPPGPVTNPSYFIPEQPTTTATTCFIPQPALSEGVPVFPVAEPVPEKEPGYISKSVYERSEEEEILSMSSPQFPSNLYNPGPISDQSIPGPAACPVPIRSSAPEISPVRQELSNLIPTSNLANPIQSEPGTFPTIEVAEDSNGPAKHIKEKCEERRSVLEGMSDLIPPEFENAPYNPSRKAAISFNNSTYYLNPWILGDFLDFVEYHGYYVDRQVDMILGELKRSGRATPREALLLLLSLRETSRIRTDSIVFMIEDFLYHNGLISHWTLLFFARGLDAGWYITPLEGHSWYPSSKEGPHAPQGPLVETSQPPPLPRRSGTHLAETSTMPTLMPTSNQMQTSSKLNIPTRVKVSKTELPKISLIWDSNANRYWYKCQSTTPGTD